MSQWQLAGSEVLKQLPAGTRIWMLSPPTQEQPMGKLKQFVRCGPDFPNCIISRGYDGRYDLDLYTFSACLFREVDP